jgi:hypothetical protein
VLVEHSGRSVFEILSPHHLLEVIYDDNSHLRESLCLKTFVKWMNLEYPQEFEELQSQSSLELES